MPACSVRSVRRSKCEQVTQSLSRSGRETGIDGRIFVQGGDGAIFLLREARREMRLGILATGNTLEDICPPRTPAACVEVQQYCKYCIYRVGSALLLIKHATSDI